MDIFEKDLLDPLTLDSVGGFGTDDPVEDEEVEGEEKKKDVLDEEAEEIFEDEPDAGVDLGEDEEI